MPVPDFKTYCAILDRARAEHFALPAANVTSLTTANAVLRGLAESKADGIIQVSTGGGAFASGTSLKDSALGAISIAEHVHRVADRYPIYVALHTDHCLKDKLDKFVIPLVEETEKRRAAGRPNLFTGHMFDGSNLSLQENLDISAKLLERFAKDDLDAEHRTRRRLLDGPSPRVRSRRWAITAAVGVLVVALALMLDRLAPSHHQTAALPSSTVSSSLLSATTTLSNPS